MTFSISIDAYISKESRCKSKLVLFLIYLDQCAVVFVIISLLLFFYNRNGHHLPPTPFPRRWR